MSDQGELDAWRVQAEQMMQARINGFANNLPLGYGTPERIYHAAREAAEHYGYTGAARQRFAEIARARYLARLAEAEPGAEGALAYRAGDLVTVWIGGVSPCNAIIRRPNFQAEGEWWYLCSMSGMFGAEHLTPMPEHWIKRPGEAPPVIAHQGETTH